MFQTGSWTSIEELEDSININELHRLFWAQQRKEHRERQFLAAMQGVELPPFDDPDYKDVPSFEEVTERAKQRQRELYGKSAYSNNDLTSMCFEVETI